MPHRSTLIYSCIQAFFWMAWAALLGFSSTYLLSSGLTSFDTGLLMGFCSLLSAVFQPVLAGFIDRKGFFLLKPVIILLSALSAVLCGILPFLALSPLVTGILFSTAAGLLQLSSPLLNTLASTVEGTDFGIARGIGSLGYAIIFYIIGWLCDIWSHQTVVLAAAISFTGVILTTAAFRSSHSAETGNQPSSQGSFPARYRSFMITLAGVLLLYISHVYLGNYGYQIVLSKSGNSVNFGTGGTLAAIAELPVMFLFGSLLKKKPASFWVRITGFSFFLKAAVIFLSVRITGYYAAMAFQLTGWGMIQVASVYYVNEVIPAEDAAKGQSMFTSALALATVFGSFTGGWLIDTFSVRVLVMTAVCFAAAGALIVFFSMKGRISA